EAVIHQFKLVSEGMHPPAGDSYVATESARGEKGYFIVSDGSNRPARVHVRTPSFYNLQTLPAMVANRPLSDVVVAVASIDIILGVVDRVWPARCRGGAADGPRAATAGPRGDRSPQGIVRAAAVGAPPRAARRAGGDRVPDRGRDAGCRRCA